MGVGPSGRNNKIDFHETCRFRFRKNKAKAVTVTYSGGSVCKKKKDMVSF